MALIVSRFDKVMGCQVNQQDKMINAAEDILPIAIHDTEQEESGWVTLPWLVKALLFFALFSIGSQ